MGVCSSLFSVCVDDMIVTTKGTILTDGQVSSMVEQQLHTLWVVIGNS